MSRAVVLLVAKAPVAGQVKTRLAVEVGDEAAAELAAAAFLDTLDACEEAFTAARCFVALAGDLSGAAGGTELKRRLTAWTVLPQRGEGLAERVTNAHLDVAALHDGPVVQLGMDTPHLAPRHLRDCADQLERGECEAVLGLAQDGGWWLLGLADPTNAAALLQVPMSTTETGRLTVEALEGWGLNVADAPVIGDVDHAADAVEVAGVAPDTRFAQRWLATAGIRQ